MMDGMSIAANNGAVWVWGANQCQPEHNWGMGDDGVPRIIGDGAWN